MSRLKLLLLLSVLSFGALAQNETTKRDTLYLEFSKKSKFCYLQELDKMPNQPAYYCIGYFMPMVDTLKNGKVIKTNQKNLPLGFSLILDDSTKKVLMRPKSWLKAHEVKNRKWFMEQMAVLDYKIWYLLKKDYKAIYFVMREKKMVKLLKVTFPCVPAYIGDTFDWKE